MSHLKLNVEFEDRLENKFNSGQRTGLRSWRFHRPSWPKRIQNNSDCANNVIGLGSHFTVTGNFNLNMMLKIELKNIKIDNLLIMDIKGFYIHVQTYHNSPIKKRYAGCTVVPGIDPPLLVSSSPI
jgi:hypothetical protein